MIAIQRWLKINCDFTNSHVKETSLGGERCPTGAHDIFSNSLPGLGGKLSIHLNAGSAPVETAHM